MLKILYLHPPSKFKIYIMTLTSFSLFGLLLIFCFVGIFIFGFDIFVFVSGYVCVCCFSLIFVTLYITFHSIIISPPPPTSVGQLFLAFKFYWPFDELFLIFENCFFFIPILVEFKIYVYPMILDRNLNLFIINLQ